MADQHVKDFEDGRQACREGLECDESRGEDFVLGYAFQYHHEQSTTAAEIQHES